MRKGCAAGLLLAGVLVLAAVAFGPRLVEEGMKLLYPRPYRDLVQREAAEFGLEEELVYGVIKAESGFDEDAQSHAGAHGLMQLTQETLRLDRLTVERCVTPRRRGRETFTTRRLTSTAAVPCSGCCWTSTAAWRWPWPPTTPAWAAWTAGCKAGSTPTTGRRCTPSPTRRRRPMWTG